MRENACKKSKLIQRKNFSKHLFFSELPRERLLTFGARNLSLLELFTLLIGSGNCQKTAKEMASEIIQKTFSQDLFHRFRLTPGTLLSIQGLGKAQTTKILAGIELGRRLSVYPSAPILSFRGCADVVCFMKPRVQGLPYEAFFSLALDVKNRLILIDEISRGSSEGVSFSPKDTFCEAVRVKASGIIMVHNHPSGDACPSLADHELTQRLQKGAEMLGFRFLDHVILGENSFYSFAQSNSLFMTSTSPQK